MKLQFSRILVCGVMMTMTTFFTLGQRISRGEATYDIIMVNNLSTGVANLCVVDSIDFSKVGEGQFRDAISHLVSFEIDLSAPDAIAMLKTLFNGGRAQSFPILSIMKIDASGSSVETRQFEEVRVKGLVLKELDTNSTKPGVARVVLEAEDASFTGATGGSGNRNLKGSYNQTRGFTAMFDGMDPVNAVRISALNLHSVANSGKMYFNVQMPADQLTQWYQQFENSAKNQSTLNGAVSLINGSMQPVLSLQMNDLEILSISVTSVDQRPMATIGFRTSQPPLIN